MEINFWRILKMNKTELIAAVAEKAELSKKDADKAVAAVFAAIEDARNCDRCMIKEYKLNQEDLVNLGMICGGTNKVLFIPLK
jgi:hypothetical protein